MATLPPASVRAPQPTLSPGFRAQRQVGGELVNCGHFSGNISSIVVFVTLTWSLIKCRDSHHWRQPARECHCGRSPTRKRRVACKERTEPMLPRDKTRDLARSLVACEADATTAALHTQPATVRVYERLRR